ncbi:lipocalin family protein [Flavobacterium sp.]|jgi:hypothetical protein|uniref:lipocalin family protein n=1 Tax=Flavobacterium sp. TaxID=239 RepID=UPI0037C12904
MKKLFVLFFLGTIVVSCKQTITETDLQYLNGYWEIEKVTLPDGDTKEYKVNETIDYFQIAQKKGFRSKVMPQVDGSYLTNDIKESVQVSLKDGSATLHYKTTYAKWNEEIITLSKDHFVVKNAQDLEYHYKRPVKFSVK